MRARKRSKASLRMALSIGFLVVTIHQFNTLAFSSPQFGEEPKLFVIASFVNLRQEPNLSSAIVGKLPIGTEIFITAQQGDWAHIRTGRYEFEGWIRRDLLDREVPTVNKLLEKFRQTPMHDLKERRQWAERLAALEPLELGHLERLAVVVASQSDPTALKEVQKQIELLRNPNAFSDPSEPKPVFVFRKNQITPIAVVQNGNLKKWRAGY
jgi:uncharacterized protein YgiM (DUF1202 family)